MDEQEKRDLISEARAIADGSTMLLAERDHVVALRDAMDAGVRLAEHVLAMADDAYLTGHPEWDEIVKDAKEVLG